MDLFQGGELKTERGLKSNLNELSCSFFIQLWFFQIKADTYHGLSLILTWTKVTRREI